MANEIFRQSALERLSSPEQLDQTMRVTTPRSWIALSAAGLVLASGLVWSVAGSLPTSAQGFGMIVRPEGSFGVASDGGGVITFIRPLKAGDLVRKGELIATVPQPILAQQISAARRELERAEQALIGARANIQTEQQSKQVAQNALASLQNDIIRSRQDFLSSLEIVRKNQAELLKEGLITQQRFEETRQQILATQNEISSARQVLNETSVRKAETVSQQQARTQDAQSQVRQAENRLRELQEQHQMLSQLISQNDGTVVEIRAKDASNVSPGQSVVLLETRSSQLNVVLYLSSDSKAELIQAGAEVKVSPMGFGKERYGYLNGRVTSISQHPVSQEAMLAVLENRQLVTDLSRSGAQIAVNVALIPDAAARSGYQCSSRIGAAVELTSGTVCQASVVIERTRPIALLIPMLREMTGL